MRNVRYRVDLFDKDLDDIKSKDVGDILHELALISRLIHQRTGVNHSLVKLVNAWSFHLSHGSSLHPTFDLDSKSTQQIEAHDSTTQTPSNHSNEALSLSLDHSIIEPQQKEPQRDLTTVDSNDSNDSVKNDMQISSENDIEVDSEAMQLGTLTSFFKTSN